MTKPSAQQLRRHAYMPGVGLKVKTGERFMGLSLTLAQLQIDNHLPNCQYPRTFVIAPIPKSVGNLTGRSGVGG
jgi:hypothetical protein